MKHQTKRTDTIVAAIILTASAALLGWLALPILDSHDDTGDTHYQYQPPNSYRP